jgi:hypothetical protein
MTIVLWTQSATHINSCTGGESLAIFPQGIDSEHQHIYTQFFCCEKVVGGMSLFFNICTDVTKVFPDLAEKVVVLRNSFVFTKEIF